MKKLLLFSLAFIWFIVCLTTIVNAQGVGINSSGNQPDPSAIFDASSTTKGALIPRMTTTQRDAIVLPAKGLQIYNLDCDNINCNTGTPSAPNWVQVFPPSNVPIAAGLITGTASVCQGQNGVTYTVPSVANATSYLWAYSGTGANLSGNTNTVTINFSATATAGNLTVKGSSVCGIGAASANYAITVNTAPAAPTAASGTPSPSQIIWNWNTSNGATGYKYNSADDYSSAIDNGNNTSNTQTGLSCNTAYTLYVWAYNACGASSELILAQTTTSACPALSAWQYKIPVTISNSGGLLTNYQVLITMNTSALIASSKMRSDGGDIRVTDNDKCTTLNFWVDGSTLNSASTSIWVKVPSVPSGTKTIYVLYGNSSATDASNGDNTFIFFDDFPGSSLNSSKWNTVVSGNATLTVANSRVILNSFAAQAGSGYTYMIDKIDLPTPYVATWKFNLQGTSLVNCERNRFYLTDAATNNYYGYDVGLFGTQTPPPPLQQFFNGWTGVSVSNTDEYLMTQANQGTTAAWNYTLYDLTTASTTYSANPSVSLNSAIRVFMQADCNGPSVMNVDYVLVRSFAASAPTTSNSSEQAACQ